VHVWLLEFDLSGVTYRYAPETLKVSSDTGELLYLAGFDPGEMEKDFYGEEELFSVSLETSEDWAAAIGSSPMIAGGGRARILWHEVGTPYEDAMVWIDGFVGNIGYGVKGKSLS
jgi:hypothetical protein